MIIHFTKSAIQNMDGIFEYHSDYSLKYALEFHKSTVSRIVSSLTEQPEMGAIFNPESGIRKLVLERHNVYYLLKPNAVYVLYIISSRINLNTEILEPEFNIPNLT